MTRQKLMNFDEQQVTNPGCYQSLQRELNDGWLVKHVFERQNWSRKEFTILLEKQSPPQVFVPTDGDQGIS